MQEKVFVLKLTQHQVDVVFDCLIGSRSCPASCSDLVNYVYKFTSGSGYYCNGDKDL